MAALNIHLDDDKDISKYTLAEYLCNLTFQDLSKENGNALMSFDNMGNLVLDALESLAKIELQLVNDSNILSEELKDQLNKTEYKLDLPLELKIQKDVEKYQKGEKNYHQNLSLLQLL